MNLEQYKMGQQIVENKVAPGIIEKRGSLVHSTDKKMLKHLVRALNRNMSLH